MDFRPKVKFQFRMQLNKQLGAVIFSFDCKKKYCTTIAMCSRTISTFGVGISTAIRKRGKKVFCFIELDILICPKYELYTTATIAWTEWKNGRVNVYISFVCCHCTKHYDKLTIECIHFRTMAHEIAHCFLENQKMMSN